MGAGQRGLWDVDERSDEVASRSVEVMQEVAKASINHRAAARRQGVDGKK